MREKKYIVALSGGKDSTAMLLRLLEESRPVDLILFCDTGLEFPQMYDHIRQLEEYIQRPITVLRAEHSFEYYFFEYHPTRKNPELEQYDGMSWAGPRNRWCTGVLKERIVKKYLSELRRQYDVVEYIGIASDELKRVRDKCYPLVDWGMTEADCLSFCYDRGFHWGGLYDIFKRVSCWCCPLQSLAELRKLWKHFPELWKRLKEMDAATWRQFRKDYSVADLSIRFKLEEEWQRSGRSICSKAFYTELKEKLGKGEMLNG